LYVTLGILRFWIEERNQNPRFCFVIVRFTFQAATISCKKMTLLMTSSTCNLFLLGLIGVVLTLGYQFLLLMQEVPVVVTPADGHEMDAYYDGTGYNLVDVIAPASTGPRLKLLSYIVTRSVFSPWILRHLLNRNGAPQVREFAAKYCHRFHPAAFPLIRPTLDVIERAQEWVDNNPNILQKGFDLQRPKEIPHDEEEEGSGLALQPHKYRTVMDYHRLYLSKKATPSQVMDRWLQGSKHHLSHLRIFASDVNEDDVRAQAKASDERYASSQPLSVWDGVPVAMKDQSPVKGYPICDGSSECSLPQEEDDLPATRLRQAGAILVGMTVMTEGGVTPLGYNAFFDGPFNPYSLDHYSGGSSSGSAVAVASGLVPMAVGWDGGGSVRVPAAMSGVVGLAVTFSRIPFEKGSRLNSNIKAGPLAATVTDAALSYILLSQPDPNAFYTDLIGPANTPLPHLSGIVEGDTVVAPSVSSAPSPLKGVRLGVFWDHFYHTDREVFSKCSDVVSFLEAKGAEIVNITIPHLREIHLSHGFKILSGMLFTRVVRRTNTVTHTPMTKRTSLSLSLSLTHTHTHLLLALFFFISPLLPEFGYNWESRFFNSSYEMEGNTEITVMLGRTLTAT
jgi:Asp-tRNA(Asn)/Glu-tRNA(Gln) amidotransferase A subunit family amidase